jgi:hypothetical protein
VALEKAEELMFAALLESLDKKPLTFEEDCALRTAVKQFAGSNGTKTFTAGVVTLPNKLTVALDPKGDEKSLTERNEWIKQVVEKGPGGAATQAAAEGAGK